MSWDFLHDYGGRRLRPYPVQPPVGEEPNGEAAPAEDKVDHSLEQSPDHWKAVDVTRALPDPDRMPRRFIDGCHRGETVAWLQDDAGHPVPVMLAEVGGVCLEADGRLLRRAFDRVERIVTMIVDPFPWQEVEAFARALADIGLRLVPASPPRTQPESEDHDPEAGGSGPRAMSYDFETMRKQTQNVSNYQMGVLEELAYVQNPDVPTVVAEHLVGQFPRPMSRGLIEATARREAGVVAPTVSATNESRPH